MFVWNINSTIPYLRKFVIPADFHIFQRVEITDQFISILSHRDLKIWYWCQQTIIFWWLSTGWTDKKWMAYWQICHMSHIITYQLLVSRTFKYVSLTIIICHHLSSSIIIQYLPSTSISIRQQLSTPIIIYHEIAMESGPPIDNLPFFRGDFP